MAAIELLTKVRNQKSEGLEDKLMLFRQLLHRRLLSLSFLLQPFNDILSVRGLAMAVHLTVHLRLFDFDCHDAI